MSFKDYIFLAKKSLVQKKINILKIFLLILSMVVLITTCSFSKTFMKFLNNSMNGNMSYRVLLANKIYFDKKELENIDGVSFVATQDEYSTYVQTNNNEVILLYGVPQDFVSIIAGKSLENYSTNDKVILCPSNFYLGEDPEEIDEEFLKLLSSGQDYLNNELTLKNVYDNDRTYEIVGVYSENEYTYGEYNICFTSFGNVQSINNYQIEKAYENCDDCVIESDDVTLFVVVDNYEVKTDVYNKLIQLGYEVRELVTVNTESVSLITSIFLGISIIIVLITFVIILIVNVKFAQYNEKNNLIYKIMGYEDKILLRVNYLESILLSLVSFIITVIFVCVIYFILCRVYATDIKTGFTLQISELSIVVSAIIIVSLSFLSTHIAIKCHDKTIMKELEDCEI